MVRGKRLEVVGAIPCNRPIKNNIRNNNNNIETGKNTVLPLQFLDKKIIYIYDLSIDQHDDN
jgi:hypothetical protein